MEVLRLDNNRVADVGELERLLGLQGLQELSLAGCPLAKKGGGHRALLVARLARWGLLPPGALARDPRNAVLHWHATVPPRTGGG
jgi:hypothetical protein